MPGDQPRPVVARVVGLALSCRECDDETAIPALPDHGTMLSTAVTWFLSHRTPVLDAVYVNDLPMVVTDADH